MKLDWVKLDDEALAVQRVKREASPDNPGLRLII